MQQQFQVSVEGVAVELEHLEGTELLEAVHTTSHHLGSQGLLGKLVEQAGDRPLEGQADGLRYHRDQQVLFEALLFLSLLGRSGHSQES